MGQSYESTRNKKNGAVREAFRATADDVLEDFAELSRDVSKLAEAAGHAARQEVDNTRDRIERLGRGVRERASARADYVTDKVRAHPNAALGATLGVGVLIGLLLSARRR
jgi:ElaB/YqjD/DUF883 family membrane-anchored ribosome-binding protein